MEEVWRKLVLVGDPRRAIMQAFQAALGTERHIGRLVLQGDAMELGIRRSDVGQHLAIFEMTNRPWHAESLRIVLDRADHVIFAMGLDPREDYLADVRRLAAGAPCDVVRWEAKPDLTPHALMDAATGAVRTLLRGDTHVVTKQPVSFPYLPAVFSSCYENDVSGWGVGGLTDPLRADIRLPKHQH